MTAPSLTASDRHKARQCDSLLAPAQYRNRVDIERLKPKAAPKAADLATRIGRGDKSAEGELVSLYRDRLVYSLLRLSGSRANAEDLANEALLTAIIKLRAEAIASPDKIGGYIFGIARNLSRSQQRRLENRLTESNDDLIATIEAEQRSSEQQLIDLDRAEALHQMLDQLKSNRYREILVRHYLDQEEKPDICRDMNLSSLHFNRVLWRAKEALKALLRSNPGSNNG